MHPRPKRKPRRPYRRTLGDRFGGDIGHIYTAAGWSALGALMLVPVAGLYGPRDWPVLLTVAVYYIGGWVLITALALLITHPPAAVAQFYLAPTGASTPYEEQYSQEDALVMQERVADALVLFEQRVAAEPTSVRVRIKAADLYAGLGKNPQRAAELFREAQRIPTLSSGEDSYIGNRLADLYMGPLGTPSRALVELRRLLDRYPDSRSAPQLREAIAVLKDRHVPNERQS